MEKKRGLFIGLLIAVILSGCSASLFTGSWLNGSKTSTDKDTLIISNQSYYRSFIYNNERRQIFGDVIKSVTDSGYVVIRYTKVLQGGKLENISYAPRYVTYFLRNDSVSINVDTTQVQRSKRTFNTGTIFTRIK